MYVLPRIVPVTLTIKNRCQGKGIQWKTTALNELNYNSNI